MDSLGLPLELVSLVHNIELNKAGWWDVAVQRLILAGMWLAGRPLTLDEIIGAVGDSLHVELGQDRAEAQVTLLRQAGVVVVLNDGRLKISEESWRAFEEGVRETDAVHSRARSRFMHIIHEQCPGLDPDETWQAVDKRLLLPAVREMGSRFYGLIADSAVQIVDLPSLQSLLDEYSPDVSAQLKEAISLYLSCGDTDVRSYVLSYLSAHFFVEAGRLSERTIQALIKSMGRPPSFTVFVDTNFLFSVLGLHANPSDEAAQTALELTKRLSDNVAIRLYVLPPTVEETRRALQWHLDELADLRMTPAVASASLRQRELMGFVRKLAEEARSSGQPLTARDCFGPYITNLIQLLRAKGVELYNADLGKYRTDQLVVDDVESQMAYERDKYGEGAKSYARILHDMILWHFAHDQRSSLIESPLEAEYWVVTVDYRLLGFDAYMTRRLREQIPVCLHPTALIQLLQFWVPRTEEFEETLYSSWAWPMLFQEFDAEVEQVTIRILRALSRYEDVDDLPPTVLDRVLLNQALRQRISVEDEVEEQILVVRDALIEEAGQIAEALARRAKAAEKEAADLGLQVECQQKAIEGHTSELRHIQELLRQSDQKRASLESQLSESEAARHRVRFVMQWVVLPAIAALLIGGAAAYVGFTCWGPGFWRYALVEWAILALLVIWCVDRKGQSYPDVNDSPAFHSFHRFRNWVFGVLGAVITAIIAETICRSLCE